MYSLFEVTKMFRIWSVCILLSLLVGCVPSSVYSDYRVKLLTEYLKNTYKPEIEVFNKYLGTFIK